jgi:MoaA/NifB/PqqE/SkfB family radical SAM enzyme
MCDIWKANQNKQELTRADLARHLDGFRKFHVQWVVFSGGEALMHSNLWTLCELLAELNIKTSLLSTGLLLKQHAAEIVQWCHEVIVSLDGSREVHDAIRNVPRAYDRLAEGVAALRREAFGRNRHLRVTARCVLQRRNFYDLSNIIAAAHELELEQISFLAADVSSTAFNRPEPWDGERSANVALSAQETVEFERILEDVFVRWQGDFATGFIAESKEKLRRLVRYYAALNGDGDFAENRCNAPWVSTVVEADGTVRPCFFHGALGNIHEQALDVILNSPQAIAFRHNLDVRSDPICRKCVCTLYLGPKTNV